jgi:hypothetical protein
VTDESLILKDLEVGGHSLIAVLSGNLSAGKGKSKAIPVTGRGGP